MANLLNTQIVDCGICYIIKDIIVSTILLLVMSYLHRQNSINQETLFSLELLCVLIFIDTTFSQFEGQEKVQLSFSTPLISLMFHVLIRILCFTVCRN